MSFTIIPNQIFEQCQLTLPARFLFCMLLKYCGKNEHCWPSQETLGEKLGLSARHVRTLLRELEVAGLIIVRRQGYNRANTYTVAKSVRLNRNGGSYQLGSLFPLHQGSSLPTKNTYLTGKGKRSLKGLEKARKALAEKLKL